MRLNRLTWLLGVGLCLSLSAQAVETMDIEAISMQVIDDKIQLPEKAVRELSLPARAADRARSRAEGRPGRGLERANTVREAREDRHSPGEDEREELSERGKERSGEARHHARELRNEAHDRSDDAKERGHDISREARERQEDMRDDTVSDTEHKLGDVKDDADDKAKDAVEDHR